MNNLSNTTTAPSTSAPRRLAGRIRATVGIALLAGLGVVALGAAPAGAVTGTTGVHYRSAAACQPISSPVIAAQDRIVAQAPKIFAANTSTALDAQTVSFRQRLAKWNGSAWIYTGSNSAWWNGFATDATAALDFTNSAGQTLRMPVVTFTAGPGYYAVVTEYSFAPTNRTTGGSDAAFGYHSNSTSVDYCGFTY